MAVKESNLFLVVEDDLLHSQLIQKMIKAFEPNAKLQIVSSAEEAYLKLKEGSAKYSMIIADYKLVGEETGLDLWNKCQKEFTKVPFIMISALTLGIFSDLLGGDKKLPPFLPKPFYPNDFKQLLQTLLVKK
jgi:CheY-like chemotaxis protein